MILFLLFITLIVEYAIGYKLMKDQEIGAPSLIVCITMAGSTAIGIIGNYLYWDTDIHWKTYWLVACSSIAMILADVILCRFNTRRKKIVLFSLRKNYDIETWKIIFIIVLDVITLVLQFKNVLANVGFNSIAETLFEYRTMYNAGDIEEAQTGLLSNLVLLTTFVAYIFTYIFLYNLINDRKRIKNYIYLVPVLLHFVSGLLDGARGKLVNVILAGIFYAYYIYNEKNGWKRSNNAKLAKKIIIISVIGIFIFVQLGVVIGRTQYSFGPLFELCEYAGGEVILLDQFINDASVDKGAFGQSTFVNIYSFLADHLGIIHEKLDLYAYRTSNNVPLGNVYTALMPWYNDFGFIGTIILSVLFIIIFSWWYRKLNKIKKRGWNIYWIVMYGYFVNCLFLFIFNNRLFSRIGPQLLKVFVFFFLLKIFIFDIHFVKGSNTKNK